MTLNICYWHINEIKRLRSLTGVGITDAKKALEEVGGDFECHGNLLISLEGAPKEVNGEFNCRYNKKKFTEKEVNMVSNVKGNIKV